jgi:hypothetical protein
MRFAKLQCFVRTKPEPTRHSHYGIIDIRDDPRLSDALNPSIGVLLCRSKDDEVVEYAMSRHLSPALVAQYETQMIPKAVLQQKLHEWSLMLEAPDKPEGEEA